MASRPWESSTMGPAWMIAGGLAAAIVLGALVAIQPTFALVGVGFLIALIPALALIRSVSRSLATTSSGILIQIALVVVLASLVRISGDRDPLDESLGLQAFYEFSLQAVAIGIVLFAMAFYGVRVRFTPTLVFWILVGVLAMVSSYWAPQAMLALVKGAQLIVLCVIVAIAAGQFNDRIRAIRFIVWMTVLIIVSAFIVQGMMGGFGSLWEGSGRLWSAHYDDRYRLSVLSFHPIMLGTLSATAALLLLAHHPRRVDWIAFGFLATISFLTNARAAFILFTLAVIVYAVVRSVDVPQYRALGAAAAGGVLSAVIVAWIYFANVGGFTLPTSGIDLDSQDARTLNGRIPLWQAIFEEGALRTEGGLGVFSGFGYVSFRHFGLDRFAYAGEAHNAIIQIFFEVGLFGLIFWVAAIAAGAWLAMRHAQGIRGKFYMLLPVAYVAATQMVDSTLADSRSFLLVYLVFHAHAALGSSSAAEPEPGRALAESRAEWRTEPQASLAMRTGG